MKCAYCAEIIQGQPVCGCCCSAACSQAFGATLLPDLPLQEPADGAQAFAAFCAAVGFAVQIDDHGRILF